MRKAAIPAVLLAALSAAAPVFAEDEVHCDIEAAPGDRMAKGKDVIVAENERIENAVAVEGNVILKPGSSVRSAVALHGNIILEGDAKVRDTALTVGGQVTVKNPKQVKGTILTLDRGLRLRSETGDDFKLDLSINGKNLGTTIVESLLEGIHECRVGPAKKK